VNVSDAGSQSHAEGESDGGSHTRNCYFGPSTVTMSRIHEMMDQGYFVEGGAHVPGEETIPELDSNEAIVFEDFFIAGLRMLPHSILSDILLKFRVQLYQLTPNVIVQLSKYFWAMVSFGGVPSASEFAKRYEFHYQPKKINVDGADVQVQYGCINFHAKHY
jgi:hypothetical protein